MPVKKTTVSPKKTTKKPIITWTKTPKEKFESLQVDAKKILQEVEKEKNLRSIVGYMTIIGWIIAYFGVKSHNDEFELFHLRQALGIHLGIFVCEIFSFIFFFLMPLLWIVYIVMLIVLALKAREGIKAEVPYLGKKFQDWFSFL